MKAQVTAWLPEDDTVTIYARLEDADKQIHAVYDTASMRERQELNDLLKHYAAPELPLIARLNNLIGKRIGVFSFDKITHRAQNLYKAT